MKEGFILKKFEIFNWGTFDSEIETFYLNEDITVVSGDNGSGKSTVVDALVSLLVPGKDRKYNLSATDGNNKKTRNELTYIRGAYKNKETDDGVQTDFLRGNKSGESTFSVLLGYFRDGSGKEVTLATFFRVTTNGIEKFFIVSEIELYLKEDFLNLLNNQNITNPISKLKINLKSRLNTRIYTKFIEYKEDYSSIFGLRQNAIDLFNKVVSLKEIKDLNSFFRENMLDENPLILSEFEECEKNYIGVKDIYEKIIDSHEKLKILEPFMENKKEFEQKNISKDEITYLEQNLKNYSFSIELSLLQNKIKDDNYYLEILEIDKKDIENTVSMQNLEIKQVEKFLENSDTTKRIREIEQSILLLQKDELSRETNYKNYENFINILGFNFDNTIDNFTKNIDLINDKKIELSKANDKNEEQKINYLTTKKELENDKNIKEKELEYFKKRENLLPERLSIIRQKISKNLGIDEEKLKFVCELVRVKEEEKSWLMPIEKLLHSFGQELLVPEELLHIVNQYVDKNNLKGKLKYNKIKSDFTLSTYDDFENNLYSKLEIKHQTEFHNWLKDKILKQFNYACLENVGDNNYNSFPLVLTISGLIKNKNSYIKDDRSFLENDYILGWDNKNKIILLEKEVNLLNKKIKELDEKISKINKEKSEFDLFVKNYSKLEDIKTFTQIDYLSIKNEIKNKEIEIKSLKENDSELRIYREKLEQLKKILQEFNIKRDDKIGKIRILESEIKKLETRFTYIEQIIKNINIFEIKQKFEATKYSFTKDLTLENIFQIKDELQMKITNKKDKLIEELKTISNRLHGFASSYREYKLSVAEKNELGNNLTTDELWKYLESQYHKINDEELYKYKEKFEKEFRDTLFIRLTDFYNSLENEADKIKNKIETINKTLKTINYSKDTFIEVNLKNNSKLGDGIDDFKKDFREKVIYKKELDMTDKIKAFEDIKSLMEKMLDKSNEKWRNNMIDVRNWFLFNIKELYRSDETLKDIYESSSGKSGGQTIKLAYSVLASALLYQYGIKEENENLITNVFSKSFRLVVIDEVFAKLDIDNSRYVLDLFKKLELQLFIITPTNTINVLEDYVNTIYFIANIDGAKSFKNKIDIKSRTKILEKIQYKPQSKQELEYLKKDDERKMDLESIKQEMFGGV
ncbi:MAG: ATP-binding protein [Candidatus Gracilibacteria bacterium]|nr:ATP-binding protein [Candidatus Gracilibacteria bacterium]